MTTDHRPTFARTSALVAAIALLLFLWSGLSQAFPWGVAAVRTVAATTMDPGAFAGPSLERHPPGTFTTASFESRLGAGVSTLMTDRSFAWVVSVPRARYSPGRYLAVELACQAVVALLIVTAVRLLRGLPRPQLLRLVLVFGAMASTATYGVMMNWWGLPARYAVGMTFNLVAGWALAAAVASWRVARERAP